MSTPTPKPISELDQLTIPTDNDLLVTTSNGNSYKITKGVFLGSAYNTIAYPDDGAVFGFNNNSAQPDGHIFGSYNTVIAPASLAAGTSNNVGDIFSTAVGFGNVAGAFSSLAIGGENNAIGYLATAVGNSNVANSEGTAVGNDNYAGSTSVAIGNDNYVDAYSAVSIGNDNSGSGDYSVVIGYNNVTYSGYYGSYGENNVLIGNQNYIYGGESVLNDDNVLVGNNNVAYDQRNAAFGRDNNLSDDRSLAVGYSNNVSGSESMAVGKNNSASGDYAVAAGYNNSASGYCGQAIGGENSASGNYSVAIGNSCYAGGEYTISAGYNCSANSDESNAIGYECYSNAQKSTAIGYKAKTNVDNTVNIAGPIIVRRGEDDGGVDYEIYSGAEVVLMSDQIDFTYDANVKLNYINHGQAYKVMKNDSKLFLDEVGIIITGVNGLAYDPMFEFGTEISAEGDISLVQSGTGTVITNSVLEINFDQNLANHNTLIAICVVEGSAVDISAMINSASLEFIQYTHANGMTIAAFLVRDTTDSQASVVFTFDNSYNARGFFLEYSGIAIEEGYSDTSSFNGTNENMSVPSTYNNINPLNPLGLFIAAFANNQTDPFDTPQSEFDIIEQGNFGSTYNAGVIARITDAAASTAMLHSPNSADYIAINIALNGYIISSNDLVADSLVGATEGRRYRITSLGGEEITAYNGHTFLWAGITQAAVVDEGGYLRGRFYWKGILVEDQ